MQKKTGKKKYNIHVELNEETWKEIAYLTIELEIRNDSKAEFLRMAADHYIKYLKSQKKKESIK